MKTADKLRALCEDALAAEARVGSPEGMLRIRKGLERIDQEERRPKTKTKAPLVDLYQEMHGSQKYFPGFSITAHVPAIAGIVDTMRDALGREPRMLDFGCGKGMQYLKRRVHEAWGVLPHCYDPGVAHLSEMPAGEFDIVLCIDVLEHVEEADVAAVLSRIFDKTAPDGIAFLAISTVTSRKKLPDGRSVHVTVQPGEWWEERIRAVAAGRSFAAVYVGTE
jgi:SAM-dependent methyltransferase